MKQVAIDFGTTNTVVAVWREAIGAPETLSLPGLSAPAGDDSPPLVPSLLYVLDGQTGEVIAGQAVRDGGHDVRGDARFFASFKRSIAAASRPLARELDGMAWDEAAAGRAFLSVVLAGVAQTEPGGIGELVLSVPVHSFEQYLRWLRYESLAALQGGPWGARRVRIVDESTAAALGYEVRAPGALALVFDFGGGTLDISLVHLPMTNVGGLLFEGGEWVEPPDATARVIAKASRVLGGDDIDHWLLDDLLSRHGVGRRAVGSAYAQLKLACEATKIRLSSHEMAEVAVFNSENSRVYRATWSRTQFEELLERHDFYATIQRTIDKTLRAARQHGIQPEDIGAVLMVGGSALIPSVARMLRALFGRERVYHHKPFEAVAHGGLSLAVGIGLDDFLFHSYAIRHLSAITGRHEYEEIIPAGTRYPLAQPVELTLTASRDGQGAIELVIGEIEEGASGASEVMFGERAVLLVEGGAESCRVVALNDAEGARTVARLDPPGRAGMDRVRVLFDVDANRTLRVTVVDLETGRTLLYDAPVVELR
jgi:molecular chaperone DnaK (HSP70)